MAKARKKYLVFISHSSLDAWIARVMKEKIGKDWRELLVR